MCPVVVRIVARPEGSSALVFFAAGLPNPATDASLGACRAVSRGLQSKAQTAQHKTYHPDSASPNSALAPAASSAATASASPR